MADNKDNPERELVRATFRQAGGSKLLELWRTLYVEQPVYRKGRGEPIEDVAYREAQRQFVKRIEDMLHE